MTSESPTKSSIASRLSHASSFDSVDCLPSPLSQDEAGNLARQMYQGIRPHIKNRKWRFKSYESCFKHSHAVSWATDNIDADERFAVRRLNELIGWGYISHVVDPAKRFRVRETRTLYFRINPDAVCKQRRREIDENDVANAVPVNGEQSSNTLNQIEAMETKINGLDHVLEETVNELNAANGRLELMHQKLCTLVSQQLAMFGIVFILVIYNMSRVDYDQTIKNDWPSHTHVLFAFLICMLGRCGVSFIDSWNVLDSSQIASAEVIDDESTSDEASPSKVVKTYRKIPSFSQLVSEKFGAVVRARSSKSLSTVKESTTVLSRESYSLPDVETWPHRPLLICLNTPVSLDLKVPKYGLGACPLGKPFKFSSDLFEGTCLIRIKDSNSDNVQCDSEYFSGRKRIFQSVVQGRFKEEGLRVSDVLTGHEFSRPLKNLPHPWILKTASNFIGRVAPGSVVVVHTDQPKVEAILAGTSQAVRGGERNNISATVVCMTDELLLTPINCSPHHLYRTSDEPGNEPNILNREIQEDCSIFGGIFTSETSTSRRKRILSNPQKAKQYTFDTETIYTFEFYQNLFDANSYALDLGFTKIGCSKVLDGQPIQWLGKLRDGRYLWVRSNAMSVCLALFSLNIILIQIHVF